MSLSKLLRYWVPVVLWVGFTFVMSTGAFSSENTSLIIVPVLKFLFPHITPHQLVVVHGIIRKMAHLTEYFVLSLLLFRAFRGDSQERHGWKWGLYSVLAVAAFAAGDEYHQTFVATRGPSIIDVGIDTIGGIVAQCVRGLWQKIRRK